MCVSVCVVRALCAVCVVYGMTVLYIARCMDVVSCACFVH